MKIKLSFMQLFEINMFNKEFFLAKKIICKKYNKSDTINLVMDERFVIANHAIDSFCRLSWMTVASDCSKHISFFYG